MTTSEVQLESRVTRLETGYDHLATKADLADLRDELKSDISDLKAEVIKWMVGLMLGSLVAASAMASAIAVLVQTLVD